MKSKFLIITLFLLSISTESFCARVSTGWFNVQEAGVDSNGPFVALPPEGVADTCAEGFQWYVGASELTEDGYKSSISVVISAFMSGKQIKVDYENSTPSCYVYKVRVK